jgi:acyl-CoA reductase-like NAD-dependent aldehyde dehydrogenase
MGPVISAQQLASNLDYVALGRREGADLACGGEALELPDIKNSALDRFVPRVLDMFNAFG